MASEAGVLRHRPGPGGAQGPPRARPHVPGRHRQGRIVADEEIKATLAAAQPYAEWLAQGRFRLDELPATPSWPPATSCPRRGHARHPPADLRLHLRGPASSWRAHGHCGDRGPRLDGHRHAHRRALRPLPAALRLLRPAVRPGDEPSARRHPRGAGHRAAPDLGPTAQHLRPRTAVGPPARAAIAGADQPGARTASATPTTTATCPSWPRRHAVHPVRRRPEGGPGLRAALDRVREEADAAIAGGATVLVLSDRGTGPQCRPDPRTARGGRRAPPPDPQPRPRSGSVW